MKHLEKIILAFVLGIATGLGVGSCAYKCFSDRGTKPVNKKPIYQREPLQHRRRAVCDLNYSNRENLENIDLN